MKYSWDEAFINNYDATHTAARISLVSAGHTSPDPKFYMERDRWPCYGFELILRGRGFVKINGIEFGVTEGDLFILQKDSKHLYTCDANDPWEKIWFVVAGSLIDGLMLAHNLTGLYKVGGALPLRLIFNQIYDMADNHSEGSGTIDVRLLARLLSDLTYELDSLALSGQRVHFPIAHEMKAILDANIVGKVSLS